MRTTLSLETNVLRDFEVPLDPKVKELLDLAANAPPVGTVPVEEMREGAPTRSGRRPTGARLHPRWPGSFYHAPPTPSYIENAKGYGMTREATRWFYEQYLADESQASHPHVAPLFTPDLGGLPPALVITAQYDVLRDEGRFYVARLRASGVQARLSRPGEDATAYKSVLHRFRNSTKEPVRFLVELRPGHSGFEKALRVAYGLAAANGAPKNPYHLALAFEWGESRLPGVFAAMEPVFRLLAKRARRKGIDRGLVARYLS